MELVNEGWDPIEQDGDYGTISFSSHTVASKAEFIRLSQKDEAHLLQVHKEVAATSVGATVETPCPIMKYIVGQWFDGPPKLLLRVIGTLPDAGTRRLTTS